MPNRLAHEKSPYLLQHAENPVDWYPWGEDAFEKARRENRPIFLSVGYSTCHWCHVMEHESFEDSKVADVLNRYFVPVKVDREERPDVDRIYMTFVQASTGSGGWPMSVFLTPELKPFFGGTYFPPEDRYGRAGFSTLLLRIAEAWEKDHERILAHGNEVLQALQGIVNSGLGEEGGLDESALDTTYRQLRETYDPEHGGFGGAPKFPRPVIFNFLLRYHARTGERDALNMTLHTLGAMALGGIHDHIGGGFHRYATDAVWHVPHFEKMLYDQAQLAVSYAEAYQITRNQFLGAVARDILEYVLRDLRAPEGGFYSAEDADSLIEHGKPEHGEGAFYVWTAEEIQQIVGAATEVFHFYFGVEADGNVPAQSDPQGELRGKNILTVAHTLGEVAQKFGKSEEEAAQVLEDAHRKLFEARARRPRPGLDDKVLTAWNGLMISGFARAAQALDEPSYLAAARAAAAFLRERLYRPDSGKLLRRYRAGDAAIDAFLDDYAFLVQGLLDLYEASFEFDWLAWAVALQETQDRLFWDAQFGGYFSNTTEDPSILVRIRDDYDGAEPSPNSVAAMNLVRLSQMTGRQEWRDRAEKTFRAFARRLQTAPHTLPQLAAALDFFLSKPRQIVIAGDPGATDTRALARPVHERYLPNKVLLMADGAGGQRQLTEWLPGLDGMTRQNGKATVYICENYACQLPTSDPEMVARMLEGKPSHG